MWRACRSLASTDTDALEREARIAELLGYAFPTYAEDCPRMDTGSERSLTLAREVIEDAYAETLRLHDIARACRISKFHLARKFRARFGVPVHQFLKLVRVREAMKLLRRDEPLASVAAEVGFADQAHMTRVFRQTTGITPGSYRKAGFH